MYSFAAGVAGGAFNGTGLFPNDSLAQAAISGANNALAVTTNPYSGLYSPIAANLNALATSATAATSSPFVNSIASASQAGYALQQAQNVNYLTGQPLTSVVSQPVPPSVSISAIPVIPAPTQPTATTQLKPVVDLVDNNPAPEEKKPSAPEEHKINIPKGNAFGWWKNHGKDFDWSWWDKNGKDFDWDKWKKSGRDDDWGKWKDAFKKEGWDHWKKGGKDHGSDGPGNRGGVRRGGKGDD